MFGFSFQLVLSMLWKKAEGSQSVPFCILPHRRLLFHNVLVPWVKDSGDPVIPKAAVSFRVELELVSANKLVTGICYILPSPKTTARTWNDWVNEKAYGKVKRPVGIILNLLNLGIDLRESGGRNEAGSMYMEINHSWYFLHIKFQNTFSTTTAENDKM